MTEPIARHGQRIDHANFFTLLLQESGDRLEVQLGRPEVKIAIGQLMVDELHAVCSHLERTPKLMVLSGTPADPETGTKGIFASGECLGPSRQQYRSTLGRRKAPMAFAVRSHHICQCRHGN